MKLSTRIQLSYLAFFTLPLLFVLLMLFGFVNYSLGSLERKYDMDQSSFEMLVNPMSMLGHMTATTLSELKQQQQNDPDRLSDKDYLAGVNERLQEHSSWLLVQKGGEIIFNGLPDRIKDYEVYAHHEGGRPGGTLYIEGEAPMHIQQLDISFSDGSAGKAVIFTDAAQIIPELRGIIMRSIILAVLVLSLTSSMAMIWLYRGIMDPINKLKKAAVNMTEGNLNVSVTAESEDEIGELCEAFETMRLKLKGQIEQNMQYEKDSKELVTNISHDLKTPMTSIKGYVEGIMDGVADTPEKQEKYIRTIYNKVNDMESLIEELFLYAKLDTKAVTYDFARVNLAGYFEDCADEISLDLESKGYEFSYSNTAGASRTIIADPEQLKRVINNIIANSVKYSLPGRKLRIDMRISEEPEFIKVEIEDNGRGIAKDELPLIFDRSYRTDASRSSSTGGSGLGLSIAKKIIEEHGGKIWASSEEGKGTTIIFVLRKADEQAA